MAYCAYCGSHVAQVSFVPCASCGNPTNGAPPRPVVAGGGTNVLAIVIGVAAAGLVLFAIIGILAAIAIPNLLTAMQRSKQKRTMADMRTVATALEAYGTDHEREEYPPGAIVEELRPKMEAFQQALPAGYTLEIGGSVESSADAQGPIVAVAPLMLFAMATILMLQLQSFNRLFLVFAVAPTALIGVVAALLLSNAPMGFVAILGILALIGILIRNSVILVVQIEQLRSEGMPPWHAVVEATEHRMRPIMLTAAAATLALIPISRQIFWGPMAYAMMGGIVVGTALTLLFLPALYVAWFRIPRDDDGKAQGTAEPVETPSVANP